MKKNLFGAVSAALALALAITSFGCESGNDSPIRAVTDADRAALDGTVFKYVATPTEYTALGTPASEEETKVGKTGSTAAGWAYNKFENGSQNYNIKSGEWGKVDVTKPAVGDVINTKAETIALNAKDNTFERGSSSTAYAVRELILSTTTTPDGAAAYDIVNATASQTDQERIDAAKTALTTAKNETADAQTAFNTAYNGLSAAEKAAFDAMTEADKKTAQTTYAALAAKKTAQEAAQNQFDWATVWKEGARYSILDTKTVNGATTGSLKYLTKLDKDGKVVKTVDKKGGEAKAAATGSYKVVDSGYNTGSILITKLVKGDNTYVFDDDNDHYTLNGLEIYSSKISVDFDTQTTTKGKTTYSKKGRTLLISNGTLTSQKIETNNSTVTADGNKTYAFLLNSSNDTPKKAVDDAGNTAAGNTGVNLYAASYSYVLQK